MYQPLRRHALQIAVADDEIRDADQGINKYGYPHGIKAAKERQERRGEQVGALYPKVQLNKVLVYFTAGVLCFFLTFARPCGHLNFLFHIVRLGTYRQPCLGSGSDAPAILDSHKLAGNMASMITGKHFFTPRRNVTFCQRFCDQANIVRDIGCYFGILGDTKRLFKCELP